MRDLPAPGPRARVSRTALSSTPAPPLIYWDSRAKRRPQCRGQGALQAWLSALCSPRWPPVSRQTQGTSLVGGRRPGPRAAWERWRAGRCSPRGSQTCRGPACEVAGWACGVRGQAGVVLSSCLTLQISGHPWPPFSSWSGTFREKPCWRALHPGSCQLIGVNRARGTTTLWGAPRRGPRLHCPETAIGAGQGSGPGDSAASGGGRGRGPSAPQAQPCSPAGQSTLGVSAGLPEDSPPYRHSGVTPSNCMPASSTVSTPK